MIEIHQAMGSTEPVDAVIGKLELRDGEVHVEAGTDTEDFLRRLKAPGPDGDPVGIEDGQPWLDALPAALHGSLVWAEVV